MDRKRDLKNKQKSTVTSKVHENMKSSKFRFLNEQLYTTNSKDAISLFKDADMFADYHEGYR